MPTCCHALGYLINNLPFRNRKADVENGHADTVGEGKGIDRESSIDIYTLPCVKPTLNVHWKD